MKHYKIILLRFVLLLAFIGPATGMLSASTSFLDKYNITTYTMNDGLVSNHIDDLYKDSKGFLWIAYKGGGLSRFDGHNFVHFSEIDSRVRSTNVRSVVEDTHGRLWVAGEAGIDIINIISLLPDAVETDGIDLTPLLNTRANHLTVDSKGALWVGSEGILYRLAFDRNGRVTSLSSLPVPGASYEGIIVREVEDNGCVWVGMGNDVHRVTPGDKGLTSEPVSQHLCNLPNVNYFSDFEDREGEVWISTDRGLFRYDIANDQVKSYTYTGDDGSLSQNFLTDIAITSDHRIIVASLKGLNIYNPLTDSFERTEDVPGQLNSCFINMLLQDGERIFVGTEGGGINVLTPYRLKLHTYKHLEQIPGSLSPNPVNAILEGPDKTLWVGTVEGGLNVRRPGETEFRHYTVDNGVLSHNSVSALALDNQGRLWIGTWGGGVDLVDAAHPHIVHHRLNPGTLDIDLAFIGTLTFDPINNGMWIGSNRGLLFYNLDTGQLEQRLDADDLRLFGFVGSRIDHDNKLWLGTAEGLLIIDLKKRNSEGKHDYRYISHRLDDENMVMAAQPTCFYEDGHGNMWIGTAGTGVYRYSREKEKETFVHYSNEDGLPNNNIKGITGDRYGNIWIATVNGLSRLSPADGCVTRYSVADGLPDNQFYWNGAVEGSDNRLYFGNVNGLIELEPENIDSMASNEPIPMAFTKLWVDNIPVTGESNRHINTDIAGADCISLHESDKSLIVEFTALNFDKNDNTLYRYKLEGFDHDWITLPDDYRWARYTNLPAGKYTLKVKYLADGAPIDVATAEIPVMVKPYFYKSTWFILLSIFLIILFILGGYTAKVKGLQKQQKFLRKEIAKSTAELEEQKQIVETRVNELAVRNKELTERNEEISQQKVQLTEMNRQIQDMTVDRLSFFTNITHEFRTPITLIIGPIERALKLSTNPKVIEQLNYVERNSKYLLSLVNQLMDFRKIESGKLEISRTLGDFKLFIQDVITPFLPAARDRGIKIKTILRLPRKLFAYDEDSVRKVLVNLISNAIKFTPDDGEITVYATTMRKRGGDTSDPYNVATLFFSVKDTGNGIKADEFDKLFDRYYQSETAIKYPMPGAGDSGIGLYLCKSIVELYGGSITVRNNPGGPGCTFRVTLPIPSSDSVSVHVVDRQQAELSSDRHDNDFDNRKVTILVVEDNDDMRRYIKSILDEHYAVVEARDGAEALNIINATPIDFIISDLMMPVMDGNELSRCVKENFATSHIPFLMLTAKTGTESRIKSYRVGVDDYLLKPFDEEVLLARIEGILNERRKLQKKFSVNMDAEVLNIAEESRDKKFIDQIMQVLKENYRNSYFEVGDFAERLGISRSLLNKKLQNLMGQSASQLIRNYRLNIARNLIEKNRVTHNMNVSEIAYEVGFNDSKYFTRCFTRQFGITPSAMLSDR